MRETPERATHAKDDGVEIEVRQSVVVEQDPARGVHVGVRVLGLAVLLQHGGRSLRQHLHQPETAVLHQFRLRGGPVLQGLEARVKDAEHAVSVARNHLTPVEFLPEVLRNVLGRKVPRQALLHLEDEAECLLRRETVKRTRESEQGGRVGEHRVREGGSHEVGGVGRDVAALVVAVDGNVEPQEVDKVVVLPAEHVGQVGAEVDLGVESEGGVDAVDVLVDRGRDGGQLGDGGDGVVKRGLPVV